MILGLSVVALLIAGIGGVVLRQLLKEREGEARALRQQLQVEIERRSTAEEMSRRVPMLEHALQQKEEVLQRANAQVARLEIHLQEERKTAQEKLLLLDQAQHKLSDTFKALSFDALQRNHQTFLEMAKGSFEKLQENAKGELEKRQTAIQELVKPVRESLEKFDSKIQDLEKARTGAYESIKQQIHSLLEAQHQLRQETFKVSSALRVAGVRGRWGEIQLKRVVEMAGMIDHCDFYEQHTSQGGTGLLRPDMLVKLPGGKQIVVDAKAPLEAFIKASEVSMSDAHDENLRKQYLKEHSDQLRLHIKTLSSKEYSHYFQPSPEFVVLFLPGESFFSAALEHDPALIEMGVEHGVILATPTTLIALLKAVAYGWRQEGLSQNAQKISELGRELYKRLCSMSGHWTKVGRNLESAVRAYNESVGSFERRVLSKAREFEGLDAASSSLEMETPAPIEHMARTLQAPELSVVLEEIVEE
jgi:DNA recombination protein RmuC